jgi:hypothetical protein
VKSRGSKIPTTVLERAKVAAQTTVVKKPAPAAKVAVAPRTKTRVIAALKKLHPMD